MKILCIAISAFLLISTKVIAAPINIDSEFQKQRQQVAIAIKKIKNLTGQTLRIHWPTHKIYPTMIRGLSVLVPGNSLEQRALHFIDQNPNLIVKQSSDLKLIGQLSTKTRSVIRFLQHYERIPVDGNWITVLFDQKNKIRGISSNTYPIQLKSTKPKINKAEAIKAACDYIQDNTNKKSSCTNISGAEATLVILSEEITYLAFKVVLPSTRDPKGQIHFVDAIGGKYITSRPGIIWERNPLQAQVRQ